MKILMGERLDANLLASTDGRKTHFATVRSIVHYEMAMSVVDEVYENLRFV